MALNNRQRSLLDNAVVNWISTELDGVGFSDLLLFTPTQRRDALRPFVRALRDQTVAVQVGLPAKRVTEDAALMTNVDDADQVLLDLDDAIVRASR